MKKESFNHLIIFGDIVKKERRRLKMNQIAFYNYLFPGNTKEEETIKKKMNKIENGKQKSVDFDMLFAICQKCGVSADYILGLRNDYRNHENEFVCSFTGLNETAVDQLHRWNNDKNNGADLSMIGKAFYTSEEPLVMNAYKKQTAVIFLRIINYLFKEGELPDDNKSKKSKPYSNLQILHALYLMCMAQPKTLAGTYNSDESDLLTELLSEDFLDPYTKQIITRSLSHLKLDASKPMFMEDDNDVIYLISMKEILEQIARRKLDKGLDQLIASVNYDDLSMMRTV